MIQAIIAPVLFGIGTRITHIKPVQFQFHICGSLLQMALKTIFIHSTIDYAIKNPEYYVNQLIQRALDKRMADEPKSAPNNYESVTHPESTMLYKHIPNKPWCSSYN